MKPKKYLLTLSLLILLIGLPIINGCQPNNNCGIKINYVLSGNVYGTVFCYDPDKFGVAVYIKVRGRWWTKPYWSDPITSISYVFWTCDITTGGVDNEATQVAAFLIPLNYDPPSLGGDANLPQELFDESLDYHVFDIV